MAEVFGIVSGAVGIAAAFTACVDCFQYVQLGRHFGRDCQTELISLNCTRLRLTRWGAAVNVYTDPQLGRKDASAADIEAAKDALLQILVLFADSEKISRKFKMKASVEELSTSPLAESLDPVVASLSNKIRDLAIKRRKGANILNISCWAIHYRSEYKELVASIATCLDHLESLFPAPEKQLALAREECAEIQDPKALLLLEGITRNSDSTFNTAVKTVLEGHRYSHIRVKRKGKAQMGDFVVQGWTGEISGSSHTFFNVDVDEDGKAFMGNQYGGKGFWDD